MKHNFYTQRGRYMALFALLFLAFSNSLWSAAVDTVWVSEEAGFDLKYNPTNKTIMIHENTLKELNIETGKMLSKIDLPQEIDYPIYFSPNFQYLIKLNYKSFWGFVLLTYPNLDTIFRGEGDIPRFINNEEIVFLKGGYLNKYNFITKETVKGTDLLASTSYLLSKSDMVVSSKGKYIALQLKTPIGGNDDDCNIDFSLFDGKTLKRIKQLEYWKPHNQVYILPIIFSEDETKLGVSKQNRKPYDSTKNQYKIYDLESGKLNVFNTIEDKPLQSAIFTNFGNKYYLIQGRTDSNFNISYRYIIDKNNHKVVAILSGLYLSSYFDEENNLLYATRLSDAIGICINLNNIINSIENPNNLTEELIINYQNEILEIRTNSINIKRMQVTNLEGIILQNFELPMATGNFITPLKLPSGMYLVKIINEKNESFTKKIVVGR